MDWKQELDAIYRETDHIEDERRAKRLAEQAVVQHFIEAVALPAFRELSGALEQHGRTATVYAGDDPRIEIFYNGEEEIVYRASAVIEAQGFERVDLPSNAQGFRPDPPSAYKLELVTQEEMIGRFLKGYRAYFADKAATGE